MTTSSVMLPAVVEKQGVVTVLVWRCLAPLSTLGILRLMALSHSAARQVAGQAR